MSQEVHVHVTRGTCTQEKGKHNHKWYNNNIIQVAALAPLALLLVLEARCASIILCCGVVHHCSYTAHVQTCE